MMKADVLSGFKKIKVCVGYEYMGKSISHLPYDLDHKSLQPKYITLNGWDEDISNTNSIEKIPENFKNYIHFLEKELKTPISIVSVGPHRSQTLFR